MQNEKLAAKSYEEIKDMERKIERIKFCIINSFKTQTSRNNLLMFALDNAV